MVALQTRERLLWVRLLLDADQSMAAHSAGSTSERVRPGSAYRYDAAGLSSERFPPERLHMLPLAEIEPPLRDVGVALFPRAKRILDEMLRGDALPPIFLELLCGGRP